MTKTTASPALAAYWAGSVSASVARAVATGKAAGYSSKSRKNAAKALRLLERGRI